MKSLVLFLIAAVLTSPLSAQDSTPTTADSAAPTATHLYRNPHRALIFGSLFPGAGHVYAGEYVRGFLYYESVVAPIGMGAMGIMISSICLARCNRGGQVLGEAASAMLVGAGVWQWVSTARDAAHAAERANVKHSRKSARFKPIIAAPVGTHGDWDLGVEIPW